MSISSIDCLRSLLSDFFCFVVLLTFCPARENPLMVTHENIMLRRSSTASSSESMHCESMSSAIGCLRDLQFSLLHLF